jgi:SpoVK/Ycf46/Vps4 family AAA+-type ATPase
MTNPAEWQKANDQYLAAGLVWLRLRLERLAVQKQTEQEHSRPTNPSLSLERKPQKSGFFLKRWFYCWLNLLRRVANEEDNKVSNALILSTSAPAVTDEQIAQAATAMITAEKSEMPPAMTILSQRFGLSRFEQELLLLCAARDLDTRIDKLCGQAQYDAGRSYPTFALALVMFEEPTWDALSPDHPLRFWNLIEVNQASGQSLTTSTLRADERIVNYLKGMNHLDDRVTRLITPLHLHSEISELPDSQSDAVKFINKEIEHSLSKQHLPIVQLSGRDSASKQTIALQVANEFRRILYRLSAESLPVHGAELETFIRLLQRETQLLPITIYLDARDVDKAAEGRATAIKRFLNAYEGLIFLDVFEAWQSAERQTVSVKISKPTANEQYSAWIGELGEPLTDLAEQLAGQFSLDLSSIKQIAAKSNGNRTIIWQGCRASLKPAMEGLAQLLEPRKEWQALDPRDEKQRQEIWGYLVLPELEKRILNQIAAQVAQRFQVYEKWRVSRSVNRGLGISVLFSGESGTGKTLAAEVLAKVLDLDLYRIDLSSVVNKYIGETEKNLRRLFDAAEDSGVVLFFDEADALFGKRSEVKDSHDRYANIEINYLLQRLEAYNGLAILATNLKSSLDQAFMRRLRFIINFPFPTVSERLKIWQKAFPQGVPLDEKLNFERLAKLNLTGGNIHSIAINAAFLAASRASSTVTLPLVLEAAKDELRKLDKQFSEADFRV